MRGRGAALLILASALLATSWVWTLSFQLDDFMEIAKVPVTFGFQDRRVEFSGEYGPPLGGHVEHHDYAQEQPLWRPVVWLALLIPERLQDAPFAALWFRILPVLAHAAAALLLWRLALRWLAPSGALTAALLMALMPAGMQAVSWISACGDVFMTAALLLGAHAMCHVTEQRTWRGLVGWSGAALLAMLCKESALPGLALLALLHMLLPGPRARWRRGCDAILVHLPILLLLWLRATLTGSIGLTYQGMVSGSGSDVVAALPRLGELMLRLLVPWNRDALYAGLGPFPNEATPFLALAAVLLLALPAFLAETRAALRWTLACGGALLLLATPVLVLLASHEENSLSRAFHVLTVPCALLAGAWVHCSSLRRGALIATTLFGLVEVALLVHVARTEVAASHERDAFLSSVRSAASHTADTTVVMLDTPLKRGGIPFFTHLLPLACAPPFVHAPLHVLHVKNTEDLKLSELHYSTRGPLVIMEGSSGEARLLESHAALPQALPAMVPEGAPLGTRRSFVTATPVPLRAVRGLRCRIPSGKDRWLSVTISSAGSERLLRLPLIESESERAVACTLDDVLPGIGALDRITLSTAALAARTATAHIELLAAPPVLELLPGLTRPRERAGFLLEPAVRGVPVSAQLRLEVLFTVSGMRLPVSWRWAPTHFNRAEDGVVRLDTKRVPPTGIWGHLGFDNLRQCIAQFAGDLTWTDVPCEWRVVAITPADDAVLARTPWQRFLLVRE